MGVMMLAAGKGSRIVIEAEGDGRGSRARPRSSVFIGERFGEAE